MNNTNQFHNENNCTSVQESIQTTSNVLYTVKEVAQLPKTNIKPIAMAINVTLRNQMDNLNQVVKEYFVTDC